MTWQTHTPGALRFCLVVSSTDETGNTASENKVHLHATTLHLPGMDHARLTCRYGGRDFRLTAVLGDVVTGMVS